MRKHWLLFFSLALFCVVGFVLWLILELKKDAVISGGFILYEIEDNSYKLLVANTPTDWERGLMYYKEPVDFDGMIFIFPNKDYRAFWNKNTYLNLDVYWIDGEDIVGKAYLPSIEISEEIVRVVSPRPVDKVVEIVKTSED